MSPKLGHFTKIKEGERVQRNCSQTHRFWQISVTLIVLIKVIGIIMLLQLGPGFNRNVKKIHLHFQYSTNIYCIISTIIYLSVD